MLQKEICSFTQKPFPMRMILKVVGYHCTDLCHSHPCRQQSIAKQRLLSKIFFDSLRHAGPVHYCDCGFKKDRALPDRLAPLQNHMETDTFRLPDSGDREHPFDRRNPCHRG